MTALTTRRTTPALDSRVSRVISNLRLFIQLRDWVGGERTSAPDLSSLHDGLTVSAIADKRDELIIWREMFNESLENYQELLEMSPAEWVSLRESDIAGLEGMLKQATSGVIAFVPVR